MKTYLSLLSIILFATTACTKKTDVINQNRIPAPVPVIFVILNADGNNMITSKNDKVTVSYTDNGVEKTSTCVLGKIQISLADTTTSQKYKGIGAGSDMSSFSMRQTNPIKTFYLYLNGVKLGTVYYDYVNYAQKSFTFNNEPVMMDQSTYPWVNLIKVK